MLKAGSYDSTTQSDDVEPAETQSETASSGAMPAETQGTVPCIGGFAAPQINQLFPPRTSTTSDKRVVKSDIRAWEYVMHGHARKCVSKYCELAFKVNLLLISV